MKSILKLITGKEEPFKESPELNALIDFYSAFNNQNVNQMEANWLQTNEASMSNPLGGIKRGWNEIKEVYNKIFNGKARVYVEFYDYSLHTTEEMFIAVGKERGTLTLNNNTIELNIRTSRIYTLHENKWKQIHHHGSMDDAALLNTYQTTLLNN